MFKKLEMYML